MITFFAHGNDQHTESTSDLEHLLTEPIAAIPLYLGLLLLLYTFLTSALKWPLPRVLLVFMGVFFFSGILLYTLVPAISIISLTGGIFLALFFSLTAIAK